MKKQIFRRIMGWVLVLSMVTTMYGQPINEAAVNAATREVGEEIPGLIFSMEYVSGGNSINQTKHQQTDGEELSEALKDKNTALLGHGEENAITVNLKADLRATGRATGMFFELDLPVYRVQHDSMKRLSAEEIEQLTGNETDIVRVMVKFAPANPDLWDGFSSEEAYWGSGVRIYRNGRIESGKQEIVEAKLYFDGPMPENSAAVVKLGGGYETYTHNDVNHPSFYQSASGVTDPLSTFTMVCCNLEWEADIQGVEPKNALWDKWNYVTYKVTLTNTSDDKDSNFSASNFQFIVPTNMGTVEGWDCGLHVENAAKWLYNNGNPVKNPDRTSSAQREKLMVGVPGHGGVMVYDVTELEATAAGREAMSKWDMTGFTNIKDDKGNTLEPIPYYFKPDGGVYFAKKGKVYSETGLKVHDDGEAYDHKTFYVSFPMSTDIPSKNDKLANLNIKAYNTIEFGKDYTWTKTTHHTTWGFEAPKEQFTHDKYVIETKKENGNIIEEKKDKIYVAINDEEDYWLGGFKNTGNIPAFNTTAYDSHDKQFELTRITAFMNIPESGKVPKLNDWFQENNTIEFEFQKYDSATGETTKEFVSLGQMVEDAELTTANAKAFSLYLGTAIEDYEKQNTRGTQKCTYNNNFRIHFKKRINPNEELDGRIAIHGVATKGKVLKNELVTKWEKWIWDPSVEPETDEDESGYVVTPKELDPNPAEIEIVATKPQVNSTVLMKTESGYTYADPRTVPVNVGGYGFHYQLGNDSVSKIVPGEFRTGTVAKVKGTGVKGFITDKVVLSKRLVEEVAEIGKITLHTSDTTDPDVEVDISEFATDADGNYYIEKSKWESKGDILSVSVEVKKFDKEIKLTDANKDIYVALEGEANEVTLNGDKNNAIRPMGVFTTNYDDASLNVKAEEEAIMIVSPTKPQVNSTVLMKTESGYTYADPRTVPVNVGGYGFHYQLGNDSVSKIVPGEFRTGTVAKVKGTGVKGFITDKVVLSKRLVEEVAEIGKITLHTSDTTDPDVEVDISEFATDADGNYYIEKSKWESKGDILSVSVEVKKFDKEIKLTDANKDIYVALEGEANEVTLNGDKNNAIRPMGVFTTNYDDASANVKGEEEAIMIIANINPTIRGRSYGSTHLDPIDESKSAWNYASGAAVQSKVNHLAVPKGIDNAGYEFYISNATPSPAGKSKISIDLSSSVGNKTTNGVNVRGFLTKTIKISNFNDVADIKQIRLYNWDKNPNTDEPNATIPFSSLKVTDGAVTIELGDYADIEYLKYVVLDLDDFYGQDTSKDIPEMEIVFDGHTNWFDNLDAVLTFTPEDESMKGQGNTKGTVSLTDRLRIERPIPEIHADLHYYELNGTTVDGKNYYPNSQGNYGYYREPDDGYARYNSDYNSKRLGVPYDRDFTYTVDVGNSYVSKLDDFDLTITLPINDNQQGDEANTGFHTTGFRISKKLIAQYEHLQKITFFDVDSTEGQVYTVDLANEKLISEDGSKTIENIIQDDGSLYIDESQMYPDEGMGIHNLRKVVITGTGFQAHNKAPADAEHRVTFYGFSDSPIYTWNVMVVGATNYLCGFRQEGTRYAMNSSDTAQARISKMYFDTTIVAGYKDNNNSSARFDQVNDSFEHVRYECRDSYGGSNHFDDDCELDIGYKAIGSYMIDFRQYLNAGSNHPADSSHHELNDMENYSDYPRCVANNYIYTQSMNTAADVEMTVNIPSNSFDAYYMKVHPWAYQYMESVKIHRKGDDADTWTTVTDWKDSVEKITVDADKDTYYRVDLRKLGDDYGIYKSPKIDYEVENPVDKIIIKLNINREACEEKNGSKVAKNADYGTWYNPSNEKTKYMFEVTGRFYKSGIADATASTKMDIGNLIERPYAKAKRRVSEGKSNGYNNIDTATRSGWSYTDHYATPHGSWHSYHQYQSSHLFSTAKVYVYPEQNYVQKGVHSTITEDTDPHAKFSTYNEYGVSFWQAAEGSSQGTQVNYGAGCSSEHSGHSCDHAYNNDPYNWLGKHSFTDKVVLTDTLPYVRPDAETAYYGFLAKKILIAQDLKQYIDKVVIYKKEAVLDDDGNCTEQNLSDTIEIAGADIVTEDTTTARPEAVKGSDRHIIHTTASRTFYEIPIVYPDSEGETPAGAIVLGENEYITKYEIYMKDLPGDVDYAAELKGMEGLLDSYDHGSNTTPDVYVGGDIYRITEDNIVNSGAKCDWNNMTATSYMQKSTNPYYSKSDTALITAYRIPFQGGYSVTRDTSTDTILDYHSDNLTPTVAKFNVKVWNRPDEDDDEKRSAEIDTATVTNTMNGNYRLKHIYIPEEFIDGDWFNVEYLQLDSQKFTLQDLKTGCTYFTKDTTTKQYVFDVNAYIRDKADSLSTYTANNTKVGNANYCKEYVGTFVVKFKGKEKEDILDGGQYLNTSNQYKSTKPVENATVNISVANATPTLSYDGVYVDRNKTDVVADAWTYDSKPTIINSANYYTSSTHQTNTLGVKFTTNERDAWSYGDKTTEGKGNDTSDSKKNDYYIVNNLVSTMRVNLKRQTTLDSGVKTFAYDVDGDDVLAVDRSHLLPDDYIEYQITVGADENSSIPVYHPDVRFNAPKGQRIVGWYILDNDSKIPNDDITGRATVGSNTVDMLKGKKYYKNSDQSETDYKLLNISCGDLTKDDIYKQLDAGKKIKIAVITQLTHEFDPLFEGKTVNSDLTQRVWVTAHPKHTYSQYKIWQANGESHNGATGDFYTDSSEVATYYRNYTNGFYTGIYDRENTYYANIRTDSFNFFDSQNFDLTYKYVDGYESPEKESDTVLHMDERPMMIFMIGKGKTDVCNDTLHTLSTATYTISFLSNNRGDGRLFKTFDLVEKPVFRYPETMDPAQTKKATVRYCFNGDIGTDVGIYKTGDYTEIWLDEDKVIEGDELTQQQKDDGCRLLKDAVQIQWTYSDIPARREVFATPDKPFELRGIGRYRDIRNDAEKQTQAPAEKFTMGISCRSELTHSHLENVENTTETGVTEDTVWTGASQLYGAGETTNVIQRERPIVTLHTQIFNTSEEAAEKYNANASQVKGYRPGDTVWYKDTVINNKGGQTDPQGALLEPVFFDKIPEYITTTGLDQNKIHVKWYDADGNLKSNIPSYTVTCEDFDDVEDYGGDIVTTKSNTDGCTLGSGHGFADLTFNSSGNSKSTPIQYKVYKIQFEKGSRLEIGERIEVYYEATIREEDLPLAYSTRTGTDGVTKTFVDYYPKMGEYYQYHDYSYPYVGTIDDVSVQFKNQNDMMDMNYLYHDVGVSGTRNKNIDRYEYLRDSITYMPGSGTDGNNYGQTDIYGSNGYLKDEDIRTANNQQRTYYVPTRTNNKHDELPVSESYRSGSITGNARDWYNQLMVYRVRSANWQSEHVDAVIWAESRLHLQTAWLAASSQLIGDSNYLKSQEYLPTNYRGGKWDSHYPSDYWSGGCSNIRDYTRELNDDTITTLEYDQYFTSRIGAYNYGDWDITGGIEFTYVMPQGIEPKLQEDDQTPDFSELKAEIMSGGTSKAPQYTQISDEDINIEVLQRPGENNGYLTPNIMRDPLLSTSVMNKTGDSYEGKEAYYTAEEHTSWVLKITIRKDLGKWFNRGEKTGYAMRIDIPSHVYATPKEEYWYDEVMVKPVEAEQNLYYQVYDDTSLWGNNYHPGMALKASTQKDGMDYIWNVYITHNGASSHHCINGTEYFWNGSPNTPYINGMNITNREVSAQGVLEDSVPSDDRQAFSKGKRNTYASTGTRAHMRKPMVRTWTTVGNNNISGENAEEYYVDPQGTNSTLNIHVENKYWMNSLSPVHMSRYSSHETYRVRHTYATDGGNMGTLFYPVVTDILPPGIVPKDINGDAFTKDNEKNAEKKLDWTLRGGDYDEENRFSINEYAEEQELYDSSVEYIQVKGESGQLEGRYKITFKPKADADIRSAEKLKISSESARVFSFKFLTTDYPDAYTKDGSVDKRLYDQYQSNHTFVSSKLDHYKFRIDSDCSDNPYFVGSEIVDIFKYGYYPNGGNWSGSFKDVRRDSSEAGRVLEPNTPKAKLPKTPTAYGLGTTTAVDATVEDGVKRYTEKNQHIMIDDKELNMEDYPNLRESLYLQEQDGDFDDGANTTNMGVHTTNRIRVKYPVIENKTYVTGSMAESVDILGERSPKWQNNEYQYYSDNPVEYLDDLFYNVKVVNGADSVKANQYYHHGNVLHGKLKVTMVLPSIVRSASLTGRDIYLFYKKADGQMEQMTLDDATAKGFEFKIASRHINAEKQEVITFEIRTPGDYGADPSGATYYEDFLKGGKKLPGYFGYKDTLVVGIRTKVRNNVLDASGIDPTENYWNDQTWDEEFKADGYVTVDDTAGHYMEEISPEGGFENLKDIGTAGISYERLVTDDVDTSTDWDNDQDYIDEYSKDVSAVVTLLKPHSTVRIDTSIPREEIDNPDLVEGYKRVVDDPTIKSATKMTVYLDQAVNEGGAVGQFIVDWRIPFRSTLFGTTEEAPITEDPINKHIHAIGTGVWEIPDDLKTEEYRNQLKEKLNVQVYARLSDSTDDQAEGASYENIEDIWTGEWLNLTELYNEKILNVNTAGVRIDKNTVIDIDALSMALYNDRNTLGSSIYQLRFVVSSYDRDCAVPGGLRLSIDADPDKDGAQEMNEIDPEHENVNPLPDSVTSEMDENGKYSDEDKLGNAAFVMLTGSHISPTRRHVNHFVRGWARYDDTQYCVDSAERSRAGYYIARELPVLETNLSNQYFKIGKNTEGKSVYQWSNDIVINDASHMLKYTTELKNLNNGQIANTNVGEVEEDTATNPQITTVLPVIQNIDMSTESKEPLVYKSYHEVEYGSELWESTLAPDCVATEEFEDKQAVWTWHVEDSEGNIIDKDVHDILSVTLEMYDKIAGIKYLRQRRLMRWTAKGTLKPGQKIVIDFMVPVSTEDTVVDATELLSCKSYGFKPGAFIPYIPPSDEAKNFAYEIDARDVNDNGEKNIENTVTVSVNNIGFSGTSAFNRTKRSFSEYGTGMNESGNGKDRPSLVPEGTNYEFVSSIIDPDTQSTSKGFKQPVIYDVLPFVGDTQLVAQQTGATPSRGTNWRGYLHLDSIKVKTQTGTEAKQMTDGSDVNIWVGPFKDNGTQITKLPISDLPNVDQTGSIEFYNDLRGSDSEKQKYFVRLSKLLALRTSNPVLYSELEKHAQAIYVEPTADYVLKANTKLSVSYQLKAPLNIPLSKNYVPEDSENILNATADVDGWNSFVAQSEKDKAVESPFAGVYLAAPADRGYIGHYVWLDESYNAHFTDEGDYIQRDGRWLLDKATKDLDYDGQIDDPGINNVKVELLTEKGYPVNRLGEAVIEKDGSYYVIDEDTGKISKDSMGSPILTTYGPMSYTTEKDVYGHDGYFIISNIKPGKYNLRYTFPKDSKYNKYAVTTRKLGVTETSVKVYRPGEEDTLPDLGNAGKGDEPSDAAKVESLTIQTTEPIQIDAIGEDPTTYAAYDEKMTSYDLGVAPSFAYGGYAWMDIQYDSEGQPITNSINGQMEDAEQKLKNVGIHIYEVKADGSHVTAYDKNGKAIDTIYTDDNGYFKTTLYPYRSYIAIADTKKVDAVIQPSPVTLSTRALQYEKDNDLSYNEDLNKNTTNVFAILPTAADYNMGTCVDGQYGSYDRLGFGYVPAGIGAIGKYVFNDENYDGIRNEYVDKDGYYVSEPGIDDVKLVLEKYYYKDGNWVLLNDHFAETTSLGCSYTFIVDSAYADETGTEEEGTKYLCGYKVKVDMSTVPAGFTPTKYYMNNGVSDSDLPLTGNGYRYLMKDPVIIAQEADDSTVDEYKLTKDDKTYDISKAQIITKYDAGFTSVDRAEIDGVVWDDKNYDGERGKYTDADGNEIDEPGIEGVEVQLVPYVYENDQWKLLTKENLADQSIYAEYEPKVTTIADGTYSFTGVRSIAVMSDNTKCIVGYKVRINTDIEAMNYGITKYRNANPTVDSDLWKTNKSEFILNENDEYIITAKQIPNKDVDNEYGAADLKNQDNLLIHNALGWFDINKVTDHSGSDAGLTDFRQSYISGKVWADKNYDGIMDADEDGMPDEEVTVKRYYLESVTDGEYSWVEDTTYTSPIVQTDAQGDYLFEDLDTHIYKDGKYYLAGYRVFMAAAPNTSLYGVTLYRTYDPDTQRGSDLKKLELTENDDYIIIADTCGKATGAGNGSSAAVKRDELAHVTEYKGTYYDLITAKAYEKLDAGYRLYPNALIQGNVFDDFNYDGIINTAENGKTDGFSAELKAALGNGTIEVKATAYYFDGSQWKPYKDADGAQVYYTDTVDATSVDGSYEISVPTKATVDGENYLAGYKLEVNMVPEGYHITKHKADGLTDKSNALIRMDSPKYSVTKTLPDRPYAGTIQEEMDGYIIGANPSEDTASSNIIRGYDIAAGRVVKQYNVGYTAHETSKIEGIAFEDENDNGKYDKADDTLMSGVKVAIKRYVYNAEDQTWTKAPDAGAPTAEYYATTVTDSAGHYVFDNLPTHEDRYDTAEKPVLYGYTVWLQEMPVNADGEEMAATFYQANKDADDSALIADSMQIIKAETNPNLDADELKDGNTMIAHKLSKVDNERSDIVEGYDCTVGSPRDGYNLGFVDYEKGSIEGCVFDDKNMDGIIDKDDAKFENISIGLKRFVYEDGQWKPAQNEDEEYFAQTTTDANGNYIFDHLDIFTGVDDNKQIYGYEVWALTTPDDHVITRYQMNNGENDSAVLLNSQIIKKSTTLSEVLDGKLVVARKVDNPTQEGLNQTYVVEGYDVVRATHLKDYNAGYTVLRKGEINGTVFEDADYDGYLDEEEQVWEGVEVGLKRFVYEDGQWQPAQNEDEEYLATTVTDADGHYVFDGLRTHVKEDGVNKLYGYEVWVITDADGYAVTRYGKDSFLRINDQIIKADTTLPEMLDGKTIVAHKVTEQDNIDGINDTYFVEGYNVVLAEIRGDYNAGYFKEQKGSISGTVFEDINYDGKIDDQDVMMKDIEVGLKRFVYTDGAWVEDTTVATKPDEGTDTGKPDTDDGTEDTEKPATQKFFATTTTDENGHYIFDNLDTHLKETDKNKLYGYEVWIIKDPDGYAVTRYGEDSFLLVNGQVIKADTELPEMLDGKTVVAHKVTKDEITEDVDEIYLEEGYNVVLGEDLEQYNAGYSKVQRGSISGCVFDDVNYDGLIDGDDDLLKDIEIGLKRFVYMDGQWKPAQKEGEDFFAKTVTDDKGNYLFGDLDVYYKEEGIHYLYGYELYVINHNNRQTTKYQMNNGDKDSAVLTDTYQIIKKEDGREELFHGAIVLAKKADKDANPNTPYIVEGYDIVKGMERDQNNAGFAASHNYSISGLVWIDNDRDGICNEETFAEGIDVTLEKYYLSDGKWIATGDETSATVQTGKDGTYLFENLELYGIVNNKQVVYGYRVKVPTIPEQYGITVFHAEAEGNRSDLNEKTGYMEPDGATIVLADKADENTPKSYNIDGYNISHGESVSSVDAGIIPYGVGSIAGIVFEDANANGIIDDKEEIFEDKNVYLEYRSGSDDDAKFERYPGGKEVTDDRGFYMFDELPVLDENNQPYEYRVTMERPDGRLFTKTYDFVVFGQKKSNILSPDTEKGDKDKTTVGITPIITLAVKSDKKNSYNLKYELDGYNHKNAYLGFTRVEESDRIQTGFDTRYLWILLAVMALMAVGTVTITVTGKKRRKEAE